MGKRLRNNGLSIALLLLFGLFMAGQTLTGLHEYNEERAERGQPPAEVAAYLRTGHFLEATAENWESEFLQMAAYILLTAWLFQRGSSESKDPEKREAVDRDPRHSRRQQAPWPVHRGGWMLRLYEYSLSIVFIVLFLGCLALHAWGGVATYNDDLMAHGKAPVSLWQYVESSRFWFESFQNWQSEFLALASMVLLSIFLRQRGSPESKPVDAPHGQTGGG